MMPALSHSSCRVKRIFWAKRMVMPELRNLSRRVVSKNFDRSLLHALSSTVRAVCIEAR